MTENSVIERFRALGPKTSMRAMQPLFVEGARAGALALEWTPFQITDQQGNVLELLVSRDAAKLDGTRIAVSADTQQRIADEIDAIMLTEFLGDHMYNKADVRVPPQTAKPPYSVANMTLEHMVSQSKHVDKAIGGRQGLVADPGKDWIMHPTLLRRQNRKGLPNYPLLAINNGFRVDTPRWGGIGAGPTTVPGIYAIQTPGSHHDRNHADYSQYARYALRKAVLNGRAVDLADIYESPEWAHMVSATGPVPSRQPGVTRVAGSREEIPTEPPKEPPAVAQKDKGGKTLWAAVGLLGVGILFATVAGSPRMRA